MSTLNPKIPKIKFTAASVAWSYGGITYFDVKASAGSVILIDWGDGRTTKHLFQNETEINFKHDYFPNHIIPPYEREKFYVEICGSADCRITGFRLSSGDMKAFDLDVTNCPELEELTYCWSDYSVNSHNLDLSCNTALRYLDCKENGLTSLNLANNTALEKLICSKNRLSHLSLAGNFALKYIDCEYNAMKQLFICYAPQLIEAAFEEGNNIDEATKAQIRELIAENIKNNTIN